MSEHDEQVTFIGWVKLNRSYAPSLEVREALQLCYAVPNGGDRNIVVAKKLKAEGVEKGMPDINLDWSATYEYCTTDCSSDELSKILETIRGCAFTKIIGEPESILTGPKKNIIEAYFNGLRIEMKFGKNKLTKEQKEKKLLLEKAGYKYVVCYSTAEAIKAVVEYLPFDLKDYQGVEEFIK